MESTRGEARDWAVAGSTSAVCSSSGQAAGEKETETESEPHPDCGDTRQRGCSSELQRCVWMRETQRRQAGDSSRAREAPLLCLTASSGAFPAPLCNTAVGWASLEEGGQRGAPSPTPRRPSQRVANPRSAASHAGVLMPPRVLLAIWLTRGCDAGSAFGGGDDGFPFALRLGTVGAGLGVGCGMGVGVGSPLNLGAALFRLPACSLGLVFRVD